MSQQTLSRITKRVALALAAMSHRYIKMPETLQEERAMIEKFSQIAGFSQIIAAIDGTHIKIRRVGGDAGQYFVNRKGHYSINTQVTLYKYMCITLLFLLSMQISCLYYYMYVLSFTGCM